MHQILILNHFGEILPYGDGYPDTAPPFYGAHTYSDIRNNNVSSSYRLVAYILDIITFVEQRAISLGEPGDIILLRTKIDPKLIAHICRDVYGIRTDAIQFRMIHTNDALEFSKALLADTDTMAYLRLQVQKNESDWILSPYAMEKDIVTIAKILRIGWGQPWPHCQTKKSNFPWRYPRQKDRWSFSKANSKVATYRIAKKIDPQWVPKSSVHISSTSAAREIARRIQYPTHETIIIKGDRNVGGFGNIQFALDGSNLHITDSQTTVREKIISEKNLSSNISQACANRSLYIGRKHASVVQRWESFIFGLAPSLDVYIPPLSTKKSPFIITECIQLIHNGGYIGSLIPDPFTLQGERFKEISDEFWSRYGIRANQFRLNYQKQYLHAWSIQKQKALEFCLLAQQHGEVGYRDFDFGIIMNPNQTMYPKFCETNGRHSGSWVADTIGRILFGPLYAEKTYILAVDHISGKGLDLNFNSLYTRLSQQGILFSHKTKQGVILNGHQRNNSDSRILATIIHSDLQKIWALHEQLYQLAHIQT